MKPVGFLTIDEGDVDDAAERKGRLLYPGFQFDRRTGQPKAAVADVLAALPAGLRGWELATWWTDELDGLEGRRPVMCSINTPTPSSPSPLARRASGCSSLARTPVSPRPARRRCRPPRLLRSTSCARRPSSSPGRPTGRSSLCIRMTSAPPSSTLALAPTAAGRLVLLAGRGLKQLGVSRGQLITGGSATYPVTRRWAQMHAAALPQVDGLLWGSRHASGRDALLLFGACQSRPGGVARTDLRGEGPHVPFVSPVGRDRLFEIGAALEVTIVVP